MANNRMMPACVKKKKLFGLRCQTVHLAHKLDERPKKPWADSACCSNSQQYYVPSRLRLPINY
ncbi:hypothetical protein OK016_23745 [Vibrio chagasii]|nr:hypothetical protein [Vibrio chagasii]